MLLFCNKFFFIIYENVISFTLYLILKYIDNNLFFNKFLLLYNDLLHLYKH